MTRRRAVVLAAAAVVLAIAAVALLVAGVQVRETTGGLLVEPIRQLHLVGGFLLGGTAAGVAAVIVALSAVPAVRRARRPRPAPVEDVPATGSDDPVAGPDGESETAAVSPGSDQRS
ncbi:hypothetical protein ACR9E3_24005 [Actinomycetospora sp. C-140]